VPVDRHINFIQLQKACALEGCPVCRIASDREKRYLDNLLFEHVSDRGFRAAHRQAGGFCPEHSRGLASFRDGLAVAILSRDILEDRIDSFARRKPWKPKARCPICLERERVETEYLGFLAEVDDGRDRGAGSDAAAPGAAADGRELRAAFEASDGLCAPHWAALLDARKRVPAWLRDFQERKFAALLSRVSTFIELSAYGRQEEFARLSERDKVVWKEAARSLRGDID